MKTLTEKLSLTSILEFLINDNKVKQEPITEFLINKPIKGNTSLYNDIDLGLPSGTIWCDRNLGAKYPESCGDYYAWGSLTPETKATHEYKVPSKSRTLSKNNDAVYASTHGKYKMPTKEQCEELINNTDCEFDESNDYFILTSKINKKQLIIPMSGYINEDCMDKSCAFLWSSNYKGKGAVYTISYGLIITKRKNKAEPSIAAPVTFLLSNLRGVKK